jgi:acetyltransferase-like isoleucine patch superfamily enzyme
MDRPLIHPTVTIKGPATIGVQVRIAAGTRINVTERLVIGDYSQIGRDCVIEGRDIEIGQEAWLDDGAQIGGGSCFERWSTLRVGHFLHMGKDSFINTARLVTIGNEVGLGMRTSVFTHGAYESAIDGFPVKFGEVHIGDNSWLPGAIVNPGVTIGKNCVIGVGSVVNSDIPTGSLAAGVPAKVIKENAYPNPLAGNDLRDFWAMFFEAYGTSYDVRGGWNIVVGDTASSSMLKSGW